ncbi:MAG: glycosyltransferase [Lachnospiraceae bacterium]|nr:glycosyltransferase [Lachnospiraceae bacterium]
MNNISKTVAIIVTYNRLELLKECINSLLNSDEVVDILVVNNNSTDGTKEYLNNLSNNGKNKTYVFNLETNLNGAGGFNFGIKKALEHNYKYFWIMDDDTIVYKNSLSVLYKVANELNDEFGFLSSKVLWKDLSICKTNIQRKAVARRIKDFKSHLVKVDYCSFVSCFVKSEDVKNIGLPIKEFIIWTDDLEWTRRLTSKKYYKYAKYGYLCNDSIVIHKCKNNFGVTIVKDTSDRLDRYKYIYRNDVFCFKREGIRGHLYVLVRNLYHIILILFLSKHSKIKKIKTIINGYIEGFSFNPKIEMFNEV